MQLAPTSWQKMTTLSSHFSNRFPLKEVQIESHIVFYEEDTDLLSSYFSPKEQQSFLDLLHWAQIEPQKAYEKALALEGSFSKNPLFDNLLTFLHLQNKQEKKAESLIQKSYQNYPDYFFAKLNYADQCLRKKKIEEIPFIFPCFDLHVLFPDKKKFHVSEFRGFMLFLSRYSLFLKDKESARRYYKNAYLADPSHPSLILLEAKLFSPSFKEKSLLLFRKFLTVWRGQNL
jgi:hypothetical protein